MGLENYTCDRCGNPKPDGLIMSKFNTDMICPNCQAIEKRHPKYEEACGVELASVMAGDYNFPGIGKPADL